MANEIADGIRQDQSFAMEKLSSVKLVLDERRQQLQQLVNNDTRPKTAFLRTPTHIRVLYDSVCETAAELRERLNTSRSELLHSISHQELSQLSALIADLERELTAISRRLELSYQRTSPALLSAKPEPLPVTADVIASELASFPPPSRLPPLHLERASKRTRAMVLRHRAAMLHRDSTDSYQCYPRGSSFPKLKPIPSRQNVELRPYDRTKQDWGSTKPRDLDASDDHVTPTMYINLTATTRRDNGNENSYARQAGYTLWPKQ